jgi:hypothetical protein
MAIKGRATLAEKVNVVSTLNDMFELFSSALFLALGLWATAYAYGLAGERIVGRLHWSVGFRNHLRWLGPLLVALTVGSLLFQADDIARLLRR